MTTDWQPIETAPKDGQWLLGTWKYSGEWRYRLISFDSRHYMQSWHERPSGHVSVATHWMPLPEPPA